MAFTHKNSLIGAIVGFGLVASALVWKHERDQQEVLLTIRIANELASIELSVWHDLLDPDKGLIRPEEFESIDFSLPGDASYGDVPHDEFFNPLSRFHATPPSREYMDLLTTDKQSRIIFNVRRYRTVITSSGEPIGTKPVISVAEWLYAVIPLRVGCNPVDFDLVVPPNNHVVVDDPAPVRLLGCFATRDGSQSYYFAPLAIRGNRIEGTDTATDSLGE